MIKSDHPNVDAARVAERLWIGSHPPVAGIECCPYHAPSSDSDLAAAGFTFLVLCAEGYQPAASHFPGVKVVHAPFDDDYEGIDERQLATALYAAEESIKAHRKGHRVLITCIAGRNRSGLVTALALASLGGIRPAAAGKLVRKRRGSAALTNPSFVALLDNAARSNPRRSRSCKLCKAKKKTRRYHEDSVCWIADCDACDVPMVVYKSHGTQPTPAHRGHMIKILFELGKPGQAYKVDTSMRSIPSHWHAHLRAT